MKTNKMLPDSSISKVWENFRKMNGIVLELPVANWVSHSNSTFTNTVEYEGFTSDEILEVDLYDDGTLTETQISEYDGYITEFNVEDGKIVAVATTKPTQSIKILARGEIVGKMVVNNGDNNDNNLVDISNLLQYNNEDDYIYINDEKWLYAGLQAQPLIPKLTSNAGDNGEVVFVSQHSSIPPWKAFDGDNSTYGLSNSSATTGTKYLGYKFNTKKNISKVDYTVSNPHSGSMTVTTSLEYYDGVNWIAIEDTTNSYTYAAQDVKQTFINNFVPIKCYGVRVVFSSTSSIIGSLSEMQIYGTSDISNNNTNYDTFESFTLTNIGVIDIGVSEKYVYVQKSSAPAKSLNAKTTYEDKLPYPPSRNLYGCTPILLIGSSDKYGAMIYYEILTDGTFKYTFYTIGNTFTNISTSNQFSFNFIYPLY